MAENNYKVGGYFDAGNILEAGFNTPNDPTSGGIWVCDKVRGYCIDEESAGGETEFFELTVVVDAAAEGAVEFDSVIQPDYEDEMLYYGPASFSRGTTTTIKVLAFLGKLYFTIDANGGTITTDSNMENLGGNSYVMTGNSTVQIS